MASYGGWAIKRDAVAKKSALLQQSIHNSKSFRPIITKPALNESPSNEQKVDRVVWSESMGYLRSCTMIRATFAKKSCTLAAKPPQLKEFQTNCYDTCAKGKPFYSTKSRQSELE
jgi:hypothetical protein